LARCVGGETSADRAALFMDADEAGRVPRYRSLS
jgi:hypothetical protein